MRAVRQEIARGQVKVISSLLASEKTHQNLVKAPNSTLITDDDPVETVKKNLFGSEDDQWTKLKEEHGIMDASVTLHRIDDLRPELAEVIAEARGAQAVIDLSRLAQNVEDGKYSSVLAFHLDLKRVCATVFVPKQERDLAMTNLMTTYTEVMRSTFPWFDLANPKAFFEPQTPEESSVKPPTSDHEYSDHSLSKLRDTEMETSVMKTENDTKNQFNNNNVANNDKRKCQFCNLSKDGNVDEVGRLIYFKHNDWVHVNCALWSSEVYEEIDGSLQNVGQALSRGSKLSCSVCQGRGATVGCCHDSCKFNYHFLCAQKAEAVFKENKAVYCKQHQAQHQDVGPVKTFKVTRTVYIDLENESRRKQRLVNLRNVKLRIGGLTVYSLGDIQPESDYPDDLIPVGFTCSRIFWSTKDPTKLTRYYCTTQVRPGDKSKRKAKDADLNMVIDHDTATAEEDLIKFQLRLRKQELMRLDEAEILPPFAVGEVWKNLKMKDLHEDKPMTRPRDELVDDAKTLDDEVVISPKMTRTRQDYSTFIAPSELISSPMTTPTKKLNKAVGNVLKRTPIKTNTEDDLDLTLDTDLDLDNDLISAILKDENFSQELDRDLLGSPMDKTTDFMESMFVSDILAMSPGMTLDKLRSLVGDRNLQFTDTLPVLNEDNKSSSTHKTRLMEEAMVMCTWFNQNKKKKFSEVSLQCSLPFTTHVFDMDVDYSDLLGQAEAEEDNQHDSDFEAEGDGDLNDLDIVNKILDMSTDKIFPLGSEEQVFELNKSGGEVTFSLDGQDEGNKIKATFASTVDKDSEDIIHQLDGVDDNDDENNARKDFSIAGILSPAEAAAAAAAAAAQGQGRPSSSGQDDIIILPPPPAVPSAATPRLTKLLPKAPTSVPAAAVSVPGPTPVSQVFLQTLPSHTLATSFAQTFQQATGRGLQYVTSIGGLHQLPITSFPQTVHYATASPVLQSFSIPMAQGFVGSIPSQQISLMTPQGIIVSQASPTVNPGANFISIAQHAAFTPSPGPATPRPFMATPTFLPSPSPVIQTTPFAPFPPTAPLSPLIPPSPSLPTSSKLLLTPTKKIARVQPQPSRPQPQPQPGPSGLGGSVDRNTRKVDPIKALSSMAKYPLMAEGEARPLTISRDTSAMDIDVTSLDSRPIIKDKHRSVGIQAKIAGPIKVLTPRPWQGSDSVQAQASSTIQHSISIEDSCSNSSSVVALSRPHSTDGDESSSISSEHSYASSPKAAGVKGRGKVHVSHRQSKTSSSIKLVFQKDANGSALKVREMEVKEGPKLKALEPSSVTKVLKAKTKAVRRKKQQADLVASLDGRGQIPFNTRDFVNEQLANQDPPKKSIWRPMDIVKQEPEDNMDETEHEENRICFQLEAEDGFKLQSTDANELWRSVFNAVSAAREDQGLPPIAFNTLGPFGLQMLGLTHSALAFLVEQMPGAKTMETYNFQHHHKAKPLVDHVEEDEPLKENPSGCGRAEPFRDRKPLDMFSWLASRHRRMPYLDPDFIRAQEMENQLAPNRRATSLDLPMAMRFRHLAKNAKEAVGVFSSAIHGRGLYCKREIKSGEMVIEYAGELIRAMLTDKREKYYESKGIGCYMFRIDDDTVVDATMKGNAARFINHSCEPNCHSRIVDIFGKKHIIIFAMKRILPGEELTYDYKFPIEDVKLPCTCGAKKCRKYMN